MLQPQEVAGGRGRGRGCHAVGLGRGEHRVLGHCDLFSLKLSISSSAGDLYL